MSRVKTSKQLERHFKGIANHYRIEILLIISKNKNITLEGIIEKIKANEKTIGEHTRKLYQAGLISKKYNNKFVEHNLSPYGKIFVNFINKFKTSN